MADCPICDEELDEYDSEWISDNEQLFQARCDNCGWQGNVCYVSKLSYWDYRTDKEIPSDFKELKKWREENAQFYNVAE